jgi:hypothetical protein
MDSKFEVLNPWADVDLIPLRGISPRLTDLKNKTIGLFNNGKHPALPALTIIETKLKERFPGLRFNWYEPPQWYRYHVMQNECDNKAKFEEWIQKVDAVIAAVGN